MKEKFNKISNANVNEMEKEQLGEFSKEVEEFKSKTKFIKMKHCLKLYMWFWDISLVYALVYLSF